MRHFSPSASAAPASVKPVSFRIDWHNLVSLLPYISRHKFAVAVSLALLLLAKGATVLVPLVLKELVDALVQQGHATLALPLGLIAAYGALRFLSSLFRELENIVFSKVSLGIMQSLSRDVLRHLHALSLRFHLGRQTGAVARDIERGTSSISALFSYLLFNIIPTLVEVGLISYILLRQYGWGLAIATFATFAAYVLFTLLITQWRAKFRAQANLVDSKANAQAIDSLINAETVKYFGNEGFEVVRYDTTLSEWMRASLKNQRSLAVLNVGQGLIIAAGVTAALYFAANNVSQGGASVGDFVAVNAFLLQLFIPLGFLGTIYSAVRQSLIDMQRMFDILRTPAEVFDQADAPALNLAGGVVRFENVGFHYEANRPILHDVSFTIPAGKKVAVVGPSGAGKSTLSRLLFRLYDATSGRVTVDGQDVRTLTQQSLRAHIGVVPQDTVLFNDTLFYNIQYGRLDASREEVLRAASLADLDKFVAALPNGFDTLVGERGLKLSGGEKQRVAIARAILKSPAILIFDEATSSLDSASEQAILKAMQKVAKHHTSLVVAHRLSTVVDADEILVLDEGRLVERGTHGSLLLHGGLYARLWRLQQEDRASEPAA